MLSSLLLRGEVERKAQTSCSWEKNEEGQRTSLDIMPHAV